MNKTEQFIEKWITNIDFVIEGENLIQCKQDLTNLIDSAVEEELKFLYEEYAEEDNSKLHESAKPIKKNLLNLIPNWISVETELNILADKIEKDTYTENREEDNLVEHIVNEIRKHKPSKEE